MYATILDITGTPIDPLWAAEFRGYFFGDGFLGIVRNGYDKRHGAPAITARAQITTRDDDGAMLHEIALRVGGKVYGDDFKKRQSIRHPVLVWRTRHYGDVGRVCDLLDGALLPSKKRAEIVVMRRFLSLVFPRGPRPRGIDYVALRTQREECLEEMQQLHSYQKP